MADNLNELTDALLKARNGGAGVRAGQAGVQQGVTQTFEERAAALKNQLAQAGILSGSDLNAAQNNTPFDETRNYSPEATSALGNLGFKTLKGQYYQKMAGVQQANADTKAAAERSNETHQRTGEALGQGKLDEKTAYDQGVLAARNRAALAKMNPMLSASSRGTAEFATTLLPHMDDFENLVHTAAQKGLIGPAAGRVYSQFLAGKVGSTGDAANDEILGELKSTASLLASGMSRMHFGARGGQQVMERFSNLTDVNKLSEPLLKGDLKVMRSFANGYKNIQAVPAAGNTPPAPAPLTAPAVAPTGLPTATAQATHRWNPQTGQVEEVK